MRRLLVESAQMIVRDSATDTDLKVKGMRFCRRGAKIAKRKAIAAVARSLAVLMVAMLKHPNTPYAPLSERCKMELLSMKASA